MQVHSTAHFATSLPVVEEFSNALPLTNYRPVPEGWRVACSDVVASRKAISEGRYKSVNMAGVAMISAIMNALDNHDIPYIFGGDGAAVAFAPQDYDAVHKALAKTIRWVEEELELELRAAIVPVDELRRNSQDVLVATVRVSPAMCNFAFAGGGVGVAEKWMKEGRHTIEKAPANERPDLTGLSCRWTPVRQDGRKIVSLILEPVDGEPQIPNASIKSLFSFLGGEDAATSPMPSEGPGFSWPPAGLALEARATGMNKVLLYSITLLAWILDRTGWPLGKFDPVRYREFTAMNTDYRKIQDGLRMTLSLSESQINELETLLETGRVAGQFRFGICVQDSAVLTCFVPSILEDNHFHFLDGAGGGYAEAATNLR